MAWILGFGVDVEGWPRSTNDFLRLELSKRIHFSSPLMILCRKSFFRTLKAKWVQCHAINFYCFRTIHAELICLLSEPFPSYVNVEMACCVTSSCSASFFSACAEFISSSAYNSSVSIFWGYSACGSSSRLWNLLGEIFDTIFYM